MSTDTNQFIDYLSQQWHHPMCLLLLQMLLILAVARLFGMLFVAFKQPAVIGEIVAGIVLGISVFGHVFPHFFGLVFPEESFKHLDLLSKIGLALFMFVIGMELDIQELRQKASTVIIISQVSIIIPFIFGILLAYFVFPIFQMPKISFLVFAIFMGISLSITAFPVLARIVKSRSLHKTPLGNLVLSIAALSDVTAWCLLAIIIAIAKAGTLSMALFTIVNAIVFILCMFFVIRPSLEKIISRLRTAHYGDQNIVVLAFIVLLLSAFISELIGIHMLFGAFLAGVIMPQNESLKTVLISKIEDVSELLLLPLFFAFTGLRLQLGSIDSAYLWLICGIIIMVAMLGKFLGSTLPARMTGMNWKDSLSIGAFMNTRGLMELIVLNIGYDLGILSPQLFAMLVLMAITTTVATTPLLDLIESIFNPRKSR